MILVTKTSDQTRQRVCVCFPPIYSWRQVCWMYQPGSHRRKITQDFTSTILLRCMPFFFSREGFGRPFPSSTVKSNSVYSRFKRSSLVGHIFLSFFFFSEEKFQLPRFELTPQCVRRLRGYQLSYRGHTITVILLKLWVSGPRGSFRYILP